MQTLMNILATLLLIAIVTSAVKSCSFPEHEGGNYSWLKYSMFLIPVFSIYMLKLTTANLRAYLAFKKRSVLVDAEVVSFRKYSDNDDGGNLYISQYQYTWNGSLYSNESTVSSSRKPELNTAVRLRIDPDEPIKFADTSLFYKSSMYIPPIMCLVGLCLGIIISVILIREAWF